MEEVLSDRNLAIGENLILHSISLIVSIQMLVCKKITLIIPNNEYSGILPPNYNPKGDCKEGYKGILCADCEPGYSRSSSFDCKKCPY